MTRRTSGSATKNGTSSHGPTDMNAERIKTLLRWLARSRIHVGQQEAVSSYLHEHPELIEATRAAAKSVAKVIAGPYECELDFRIDPEIDDPCLRLVIRLDKYEADLLDALDIIQESADKHLSGGEGRLLVTSDFGTPGNITEPA